MKGIMSDIKTKQKVIALNLTPLTFLSGDNRYDVVYYHSINIIEDNDYVHQLIKDSLRAVFNYANNLGCPIILGRLVKNLSIYVNELKDEGVTIPPCYFLTFNYDLIELVWEDED